MDRSRAREPGPGGVRGDPRVAVGVEFEDLIFRAAAGNERDPVLPPKPFGRPGGEPSGRNADGVGAWAGGLGGRPLIDQPAVEGRAGRDLRIRRH